MTINGTAGVIITCKEQMFNENVKYYELEEHVKYEDRGAVIYRTQIDDLDEGYDNSGYYNGKEEIFLLESYVEIGEDSEE